MQTPTQRILEIVNELKKKDGKEPQDGFHNYEAKAIAMFLDELDKDVNNS